METATSDVETINAEVELRVVVATLPTASETPATAPTNLATCPRGAASGSCREEASSASSSDELATVNCISQAWQGEQYGSQFCQAK